MSESMEDRIARMDEELWALRDKSEIMELEARATMAYDRLDIDLLSTSFAPDATADYGYMFQGAVKDLMVFLRSNAASWGQRCQYHPGPTNGASRTAFVLSNGARMSQFKQKTQVTGR